MATLGRTSPSRLVRTDRDLTLTRTSPEPHHQMTSTTALKIPCAQATICILFGVPAVTHPSCPGLVIVPVSPPKNTHGGFTYLAVSRHIMAMKTLR
jgi:hypothetical protein